MAGRLAGKRVIITGAGSGIGRASAELFAQEGAKILAIDLNEASINETAETVRNAGGTVISSTADVGDEEAVKEYVARCVKEFGGIDVMFANAGIGGGMLPLLEQPVKLWEDTLRVNLIGPFLAIKHAAPHMLKQGHGSIICTASLAGIRANAGASNYSASKAGVISLVQTAANEFYGSNVRVNAVCPGLIETGMTKPLFDGARARGKEDKIGQLNPMARYGVPMEIAYAALFLASDEASYVNGQAFCVDGGLTSTLPFAGKLPYGKAAS
jgi:NAD(P)-dependent dehydrogenase (short-subunit alcohol dehydrogenase family)